ncbi:hypothetical protein QEG98_34030 [Myxococcus sp. MxC21-1]|uniref:hypothetical protein n=1 Tax=Myxococcus sp. MxC21-1 TaxID=3041439 RepID=UPI002931E0A3|nr:hypothetical protein [Myxococcus sp. MxC21-1]WNZ60902.1 hypothetical protein QEG98_34030 [Myxococcus sp. MxC21-1]
MNPAPATRPFLFNHGAALDDGTLYVAGVVRELEDRDVPHTILWERVAGEWRRFQWKNRTYGMVAYALGESRTVVYLGYDGTLKVRNDVAGSSEEQLTAEDDGPSVLRTVSGLRVVGDRLFVAGMRRMVFSRPLGGSTWERVDEGVRQARGDRALAGIYTLDGHHPGSLYAAGIGGEVWHRADGAWSRLASPTGMTLSALRSLGDARFVMGGERGALWRFEHGAWSAVSHPYTDETFSCIQTWRGRCFVSTQSGAVFELSAGDSPSLEPFSVPGTSRTSWMAATSEHLWFFGSHSVSAWSEAGWRDESPPAALLE